MPYEIPPVVETKPWYTSKTIWIGVLTTITGLVPLVVELILKQPTDAAAISAAVGAFILGAIQIVRRVWLDGETTPPALK
jgi:VIT1/CCC1 family predicted Fe2+/Mn2+ transporter